MWNTIKQDRQRHMQTLRQTLEKEAKEEKKIIVLANSEMKAE